MGDMMSIDASRGDGGDLSSSSTGVDDAMKKVPRKPGRPPNDPAAHEAKKRKFMSSGAPPHMPGTYGPHNDRLRLQGRMDAHNADWVRHHT
jgi:hypothetical protein